MGRMFLVEIPDFGEKMIYTCAACEQGNNGNVPVTHIASEDDRTDFGQGPPFFSDLQNCAFRKVVNIIMLNERETERLYFGSYIVKEVQCVQCCQVLGSYYITSLHPNFRYIEGYFFAVWVYSKSLEQRDQTIRLGQLISTHETYFFGFLDIFTRSST